MKVQGAAPVDSPAAAGYRTGRPRAHKVSPGRPKISVFTFSPRPGLEGRYDTQGPGIDSTHVHGGCRIVLSPIAFTF
jgi:hypothetical protein